MFQYTHELVLNTLTDVDGSSILVRNGGDSGPLTIKRGGEYWKAFIQDQKVYKTVGNVGTYEILKLDVSTLMSLFPGTGENTMAPGVYQLNMFVKLLDPHALYEFGYPMYQNFGRHILVGFDVVPSDTAASIAKKIYEALDLAVRKEEFKVGGLSTANDTVSVIDFTDESTVVAMMAKHYGLRFDTVGLALYDETTCDSCVGEYLAPISLLDRGANASTAATIAQEGVEPFATGQWLIENLRFPSYPNVRYNAIGSDNYPVPGVTYVEYSFAYDSPRPQFGGLSGVGQKVEAVTRHIYYVPEALASTFEAAFTDLGVSIVATNEIEITDPDANAVEGGDDSNDLGL